jgi:hypothetical protein
MKVFFGSVIALFMVGGISAQLASNQSSSGCNVQDAPAQLLPADPVYADAIDVANTLNGLGVPIRCILASKMQHIFIGQKGAAFYRIDDGSFEVLFLPKTQSFDSLQIVERRESDRYIYSFRGTPRPQTNLMDSSKPICFIKKGSLLFYVWGQPTLAATLQSKLTH